MRTSSHPQKCMASLVVGANLFAFSMRWLQWDISATAAVQPEFHHSKVGLQAFIRWLRLG